MNAVDAKRRPLTRVTIDLDHPAPPPIMLNASFIYEGGLHVLQSEPGVGKGWVGLWLCLEALEGGYTVLYFDEEGGEELITERLLALGADTAAIRERFFYFPFVARRWDEADVQALRDVLDDMSEVGHPGLAVFDSLADFLAAAGVDEDKAGPVTDFVHRVCTPLRDAKCAQLFLDHLAKPRADSRGNGRSRYSRGSGSKLAKADATFLLETESEFDRNRSGALKLWVTKDRRGRLPLPRLGDSPLRLRVEVDGEHHVTITAQSPEPSEPWDGPTRCMTAVLELLDAQPTVEHSIRQLTGALQATGHPYHRNTVAEALERLAFEGRVEVRNGPRNSRLYRATRPIGARSTVDEVPLPGTVGQMSGPD